MVQTFDEELADFDVVTPAWDGEAGVQADFDSQTDADNDMNDTVAAAHDGATGLEFTFDDVNPAHGNLNLDAINQKTGVASFWWNKNDLAVEATKVMTPIDFWDGAAVQNLLSYYRTDADTLEFHIRLDGAAGFASYTTPAIGVGWHKVDLHFAMSTGVGNDDGYMRVYVDDVLLDTQSGLDNDTKDWDYAKVGMVYSNSTTFGGSFYMDTIKIDTVGGPMIDKLAAQTGTYGMSIPIMDATVRRGYFTDPTTETAITAECEFDPNTLTMGAAEEFTFMSGDAADFTVNLKYDGGYKINAVAALDAGSDVTSDYAITDAPHTIRVVWSASTGAGLDDGYLKLYIDDVLKETLSGLDNDTLDIGTVAYGCITGMDAGTYGIIYFDDCWWESATVTAIPLGTLTITGLVPTHSPLNLDIPLGTLTLTGLVPTWSGEISFDIPLGTLTITGYPPLTGDEVIKLRTADGTTLLASIVDGDATIVFSDKVSWYTYPLLATKARGSFYGEHIDWSQVAAEDTDYNISDDTIQDGYTNKITSDGSGKLTISKSGMYLINWSLVYQSSIANKHIEVGIEINDSGTHEIKGCQHVETKFKDQEETLSGTALIYLYADDFIEIAIGTTDDGTPTITVQDIDLTIVEI